ncbi:hypothetical protein [Pasteuria penetrans]|uniref:hypothetical protein n=1 Tax=Pasteuria penetrans TaxID=86005 RepID=UPI000F930AB6|nr:hypothetical protein [Pasteuria penetrans]
MDISRKWHTRAAVGLVLSSVLGSLVSTQVSLADVRTHSSSQSLQHVDEPWRCGDHGDSLWAGDIRKTENGKGFKLYYDTLSYKTKACKADHMRMGGIVATPRFSFVNYKEENGKSMGLSYDLVYEMSEGVSVEKAEYAEAHREGLHLTLRVSDGRKLRELRRTMNLEGAPPGFEKGQIFSIKGKIVYVVYPVSKGFPVWR